MAENTVKVIENNIIEVRFVGDQSYEAVKDVVDQVVNLSQEFVNRDEWVKVLVDLNKQGKTNSGSRRASKEAYNYATYDKLVVFGGNTFIKHFVNAVIKTSGRQSKARVVDSREQALAWLEENPKELKI